MTARVYSVLFPFGGIGGGALGMKRSSARLFGYTARFRVIGGIDFDRSACADFEKLVGAPALCADIAHLSRAELLQLSPETPDVVFLSPPCKGASGLLSAEKAKTAKYQAMNRLALDWIELMLSTWDTPPRFVLFENVPRLKQRAGAMLRRVRSLLHRAGYVFHDGFHDCGELGGLAQVRRRYLLVARHASRVPPLLYQPPKKRVRGCGEVLGLLPMPADPAGGPMHRLPRLSWLNWVRLALIPAGGDWRDLEGVLRDGQPRREVFRRHKVQGWGEPADTVAGSGSNGPSAVADPRALEFTFSEQAHRNKYAVQDWAEPAATVIGATRPGSGGPCVADPRISSLIQGEPVGDNRGPTPSSCAVKGAATTGNSSETAAGNVAMPQRDPENVSASHTLDKGSSFLIPDAGAYDHGYGVLDWREPSSTIAAGSNVGQGAYSVADVRLNGPYYNGTYGVMSWQEAAGTITGNARHDTGRFTVADPRKPPPFTPYIIAADGTWHRPITTLECAALQSIPTMVNGEPLVLVGSSHSAWRERIGNAVPPDAAAAIGDRILVALLQADCEGFALSSPSTPVWVREFAEVRA
jgi:site-specific DNA-cytosine methylase